MEPGRLSDMPWGYMPCSLGRVHCKVGNAISSPGTHRMDIGNGNYR